MNCPKFVKNKALLFVAACLLLCLLPSVGMLLFPTNTTTENRTMAAAPKLVTEEGGLNTGFFQDFKEYFNEHAALRNQLVYIDAGIQNLLFHESDVDGVIAGTDGWLYYSSTLDDYLGRSVLSDRNLHNLAHNFALVQEYLEKRHIDFLLTIPPNKNTLYREHMPYYASYIVNKDHSAELLAPLLAEQKVRYLNLFERFSGEDEVLYLKRDSHWNQKGACMAYNDIMDALDLAHEDYADAEPALTRDQNGDLNRMLYSFYGPAEETYAYDLPQGYTYQKEGADVEDGWIVTENKDGDAALLMFRDSFANTLIPFLSNAFETACYSKGEPNALERYVEEYAPDCVVIEKVERNIADYLNDPPILTAVKTEVPKEYTISPTDSTVDIALCENDAAYYAISGTIDMSRIRDDTDVFVDIEGLGAYRAYQTEENGYLLYLKKSAFAGENVTVRVYFEDEEGCVQALKKEMKLPEDGGR